MDNHFAEPRIMRLIARQYSEAPLYQNSASDAWEEVANHAVRHASLLRQQYRVRETETEGMPYASADDMFRDLDAGVIVVSSANSVHPLWSKRDNVAFRLVHDIMGHYTAHNAGMVADFSWQGEVNAYDWHARTLSTDIARDALFTEVLGQAAYALVTGRFGDQKVAFL